MLSGISVRSMRRVGAVLLGLALAAAAWAPPAAAQTSNTAKLVTGNNYHPYTDETLPQGGIGAAIVRTVFAEMGFDTEIAFLPWDAGYEKAREGHYLATFPYIDRPERRESFAYTDPIFTVRPALFWNVNRKIEIGGPADLKGRSLCTPEGWAVDDYLQPYVESGDLSRVTAPSLGGCFERLELGTADMVSADQRAGRAIADQIDESPWTKSRRFVEDGTPNHVLFTRTHPQAERWAQAFNAKLAELREAGAIYEVIKRYYAERR